MSDIKERVRIANTTPQALYLSIHQNHFSGTIYQPHDVLRGGVGQDGIHQSDGLDGAKRLVIQADSAGEINERVHGFEHRDPPPVHAENVGQHQAGWSGANDQDFAVLRAAVQGVVHDVPSEWSKV